MTTIPVSSAVYAWAGRRLQELADRRVARQRMARSVLVQVWNLLLVLGGLASLTYAAWIVSEALGFAIGGVALFVLRSLVDWRSTDGSAR